MGGLSFHTEKKREMPNTPLGRFSWHEVMTTDVDAARSFYTKITGWGTMMWDGGDKPYEMWMNGEVPVGGLMGLPAPDVPPCWLAYLSTPDIEATLGKVRALGGSVMGEMQVPEVGRFAVISDPQGAVIAILEPEGETGGHDGPAAVGEFSWHELATTDTDAAWTFYSEVFGWEEYNTMDMGDMGIYRMYSRGAHPLGGIMNSPPGMSAGWMLYIRVPDTHAAAEVVKELGGQVIHGPIEVPGGDYIAHCMDPQGVAFAVHSTSGD